MQIVLETSRLYLRKFTEEDAALILDLNQHPEIVKYVHEPVLENMEQATRILLHHILPQYSWYNLGRYAVHLKDNNKFIGWCGLKYRPEFDEIDLGYRFVPTSWGNGYAFESATQTLIFGFDQLHLKRIVGRAHIENIASLKVLRKIGMNYIRNEMIDGCPIETYESINPKC